MCHHVCSTGLRYLGALPVCFLESFLDKNEIRWMIALHCLLTSTGNLQNMFSEKVL